MQRPMLVLTLILLSATMAAVVSGQNTVISAIGAVPADRPLAVQQAFAKHMSVFGIDILASASTTNANMRHAATIMAEYLDNNADGVADDATVVNEMKNRNAALIMTRDEAELERLLAPIEDAGIEPIGWQTLFDAETTPNGAAFGEFDATLEEVLHLISHVGYANVYPNALGEHPGTLLTDAMDEARGGRFFIVPNRYPANAWYTYDDRTCDYECMAAEYFYWALTSLLDGQNFPGRLEEIEHEWRLNTPDKLRQGDPTVYALLTNPAYKLPAVLPDGVYP